METESLDGGLVADVDVDPGVGVKNVDLRLCRCVGSMIDILPTLC